MLRYGPRGHVQHSLSPILPDDGRAAGTLHAQRGMARIGWTTAAGETIEGFVPAWNLSAVELRRRVEPLRPQVPHADRFGNRDPDCDVTRDG